MKVSAGLAFVKQLQRFYRLNIEPVKALQLFYESQTCADLHDKSTGLYLYGDLYVADEFMREMEYGM